MAIKLSTVINTSAFFCRLLFIHNYPRLVIVFYGLHAAGMNSFMNLDPGVNICLSLYNNIAVHCSWLLLEADYFMLNYFIKEALLICCPVVMGEVGTVLLGGLTLVQIAVQ